MSLSEIAARFPEGSAGAVGPFLRAVQAECHWVSREAMDLAAERFGVSFIRVYEQAAFSPGLSLEPRGELVMEVCQGLACREAGGEAILKSLEEKTGLQAGQSSPDGRFSLCRQSCFGRCAIGPNLRFQGEFSANQSPDTAWEQLKKVWQPPRSH